MIWNGRETLQIDGGMKTCNRVSAEKIESLLKVLRAERGTAEAKAFGFFRLAVRQFARMLQGPEQFLPLMVNVHAAEVRKRFDVTITPHKKGIVLEAVTKDGRDKTLCREIDVLLDVETYRTCATRVIAPNGKDSTVYVLDDQKLDHRPSDRDELMEPDLTGLRVMENDGSVLRFPRPSVAKKEWFGGSTERPLCPLLCKTKVPVGGSMSRTVTAAGHPALRITLFGLFFASGVSGLVYETVWLRILSRVVGNTVYATSVVLAAFMAGMAIGSYVIGRYADRVKNLLRLYAVLEFGAAIAAVGLTAALLHLTPIYQALYDLSGGSRVFLTVLQSTMAFCAVVSAHQPDGRNAAGVEFVHQGFFDRSGVTDGVSIRTEHVGRGCLACFAAALSRSGPLAKQLPSWAPPRSRWRLPLLQQRYRAESPATLRTKSRPGQTAKSLSVSQYPASTRRFVGLAYAISGLAAMAYEVVWTRLFQIQVGTSIYSFSVMLAFYLVGIGIGSMVGGRLLGGTKRPLGDVGTCADVHRHL